MEQAMSRKIILVIAAVALTLTVGASSANVSSVATHSEPAVTLAKTEQRCPQKCVQFTIGGSCGWISTHLLKSAYLKKPKKCCTLYQSTCPELPPGTLKKLNPIPKTPIVPPAGKRR
jgi:hypothetical protein